ncbi:MAG TPA: glycosyltransferase family 4 protein [Gemmatimonadaceae bacterium]|nr:glycosyltransferase family 4 protein [Gemmatimonadaceae bacterium]
MTALRFCMLTTFYPPYAFGGDAIGIQRLSRALVKRGHHVTVVHDADAYNALHKGAEPNAPAQDDDQGVEVIRLKSGYGILSPLLTQQFGRPVLTAARIRNIVDRGHYDVVNFHNVSLIGGPGLFTLAPQAIRLYMAHEHWLVCPTHVLWRYRKERCDGRECFRCTLSYMRPPQLWRWTGYLGRQLRNVDTVIAMSEFSRQKHLEFGLPCDPEVLPYFLPDPEPDARTVSGPSPNERPYFFFAGRLERIKGLDDVIPLMRQFDAADLIIAGDGEHAAHLRQLAAGIPHVKFVGRLTPEDLRRYYAHAIALLVPSVCFETFGIVLIESFRQGTPVIARRLGPFPEIVAEAGGGELFETPEELLAAMRRLQGDPDYRQRLSDSGYQAYVDRWSESAVVPRYLDIVHRAAQRRGHTRLAEQLAVQEVA